MGDVLFDYNFQSGNSTITAEQWDGTAWQPLGDASVRGERQARRQSPTRSARTVPFDLTTFEFGEAGINLTEPRPHR